ncbi:MAG: PASTA domain-containing protein [Solirubrobacteraceae bacterium]
MSNASSSSSESSGCATAIAGFVAVAIVGVVLVYVLSPIGHPLGLTPTSHETMDSTHDYLTRHYQHIVWGYVLTALLLIAAVWAVAATGIRIAHHPRDPTQWSGRVVLLSRATLAAAILSAVLLPVGARSHVQGNVPNLVGLTAHDAEARLRPKLIEASYPRDPDNDERCRVTTQSPAAGREINEHGTIKLRCDIAVPNLGGRTPSGATSLLDDAGLDSHILNPPGDGDESRCRVKTWTPHGRLGPRARVNIHLRCKPKKKQPTRASPNATLATRTQSYAGLTCPEIGHSFYVVPGSDPAHDRNNDGHACVDQ